MEKFTTHTGVAAPLQRSAVDTDQIIPAVYLKRVTRTGFEDGLFRAWRDNDEKFVLNTPPFDRGSVLVAGTDFGTGSSREHAVWALQDYGFKAVVSSRFADIFRTNCTKTGLLPVQVGADVARTLLDAVTAEPTLQVLIDVDSRTIRTADGKIDATFELDDFTRYRLLEGLDDIGLTLRNESEITTHESNRQSWLPSTA